MLDDSGAGGAVVVVGHERMSAGVGRTLLFVFLVLAVIFAIVGIVGRA